MPNPSIPIGTPSLIDRDARRRHLADADRAQIAEVLRPVVLVPTPAQIARGERVINARPEFVPSAAAKLADVAREHGWAARLTYSHALIPPKRGSDDWREQHTVALRVSRPDAAGAAFWADGQPDGALMRWVEIPEGRTNNTATVTVTEFGYLLRGEAMPVVETRRCPFPLCGKEVRVLKAGGLYAHKVAGAPCPGAMAGR